jgi:TRAP-type C4-dicarboxylate transport system substrate-binding protein
MAKTGMVRLLAVGAAAAITLTGLGTAKAKELRIATLAPPGSGWMKVLNKGAEILDKKTEGRLKYKYYPGAVQGDERDVIRKMKLGGLDGAVTTAVGLAMIVRSIRVLELPRMFDSLEEMDYVRTKMWPYFKRKFRAKGYILASPGDVGFVYFMSTKPVKSMADLRKTKAWMWTDDKIVRKMYSKLGVSGVPLGVPDVMPSLQTGRIEACYGPPMAAVAMQWTSKVKYMTAMPFSYSIGATVIRADAFNGVSEADIKVEEKVHQLVGKKMIKNVRRDNREAQRAMVRKGIKVVETPAAMVASFNKIAEEAWGEMAGSVYTKKELDMVLKYRQEYRDKHK